MRSKQSILGLVYPGGEIRRAPLVGMQFLHERAVGPSDLVAPGARLQAKDLIGLLLRHFASRRRAELPPCRISLRVLTPSRKPAVQIAFKLRHALGVEAWEHRGEFIQVELVDQRPGIGSSDDAPPGLASLEIER